MITVGIDVGSITTKAALIRDGRLEGTALINSGYNARQAGEKVYRLLLKESRKRWIASWPPDTGETTWNLPRKPSRK